MNDPRSSDAPAADVLGGAWAWRLGALLLLGFVAVQALAIVDRQRRGALERFEEVTAVGDRAFFAPGPDPTQPTVLSWGSGRVQVVAAEHVKMRDTSVRKVGQDETTGVAIYTASAKKGEPARSAGLFVKVAPGEYLPAAKIGE